jgi:hypothetical protein
MDSADLSAWADRDAFVQARVSAVCPPVGGAADRFARVIHF